MRKFRILIGILAFTSIIFSLFFLNYTNNPLFRQQALQSAAMPLAQLASGFIQFPRIPHITEQDRGKIAQYGVTSRFFVELDPAIHPRAELTCEPNRIIGYISNGSSFDPNSYPVRYEGTEAGACILHSRDFWIIIIVTP